MLEPMPSTKPRFTLRLDQELKGDLAAWASSMGLTLNDLAVRLLRASLEGAREREAMRRAQEKLEKSPAQSAQKTTPARNAQCTCGSGKKFKRCCGK